MICYVDQSIYNRLNERLQNTPKDIPDVLRKAINDTAKGAREKVVNQAKMQYAVKVSGFNKSMKIEHATTRHLQTTIHTEGKPVPLSYFQIRKNQGKTAAKAKVLMTSSLKELTLKNGDNGKDLKAFVATMKNGHRGVFRRLTKEGREKQQKYFDSRDYRKSGYENGNRGVKRNAIKQLYSLSIPQMVGNEKKVYSVVEPIIASELRRNLEIHIAKVMEGR